MEYLMTCLENAGVRLELRVPNPDGNWSQGAGRSDCTVANAWLLPAVLVIDGKTISASD